MIIIIQSLIPVKYFLPVEKICAKIKRVLIPKALKKEKIMAFDGITIANMVKEFQETIVGGKINKIAQPEPDELLITREFDS